MPIYQQNSLETEKATGTDKTERDRYNMLSNSLYITDNFDPKE